MSKATITATRALRLMRSPWSHIDLLPLRHTLANYDLTKLRADSRAGLNVALLAFPQAMAFAIIAGLPISYGLFGSAVAVIVGSLFAGSRFVTFGPTNATAVLMLSAFLALGARQNEIILLVPLLLAMVGLLQIAAAYLNVGSLVAYISRSVIIGYITAAVTMIIVNQIKNLLGLAAPDSASLFGMVRDLMLEMGQVHWPTALVSASAAAVYLLLRRFVPRWPTVALTLVGGAATAAGLHHLGHEVAMLPPITATSWRIALPHFDVGQVNQLASAALALAFLGILESSSIGKTLAARAGERIAINQEIFAMGTANLGCSMAGGMAASGSLTRSALNVTGGAATPLAGVCSGTILIALIFGLGRVIAFVPQAALGVVVVMVALSLINLRQIRFVVRSTTADAAVFAATAGSALLVPLDTAIFIGAATSVILYLRQAGEPELAEYAFTPEGDLAAVGQKIRRDLPEVSIVHVEGSLFFGATELLQEQVRRICEDPNLRIIILRLKYAHHLDASTVLALEELVQFMRENGRGLIVSGARKEVFRICKQTGLLALIGRENFFPEWPHNPTISTRNALKRAQELLGQKEAEVRVFDEMRTKPAE